MSFYTHPLHFLPGSEALQAPRALPSPSGSGGSAPLPIGSTVQAGTQAGTGGPGQGSSTLGLFSLFWFLLSHPSISSSFQEMPFLAAGRKGQEARAGWRSAWGGLHLTAGPRIRAGGGSQAHAAPGPGAQGLEPCSGVAPPSGALSRAFSVASLCTAWRQDFKVGSWPWRAGSPSGQLWGGLVEGYSKRQGCWAQTCDSNECQQTGSPKAWGRGAGAGATGDRLQLEPPASHSGYTWLSWGAETRP